MIIDKNGNLFGKVNIIDLCVVIFLVLAVVVTVFKFCATPKSTSLQSNSVIEYSVKISNVRDYTAKQMIVGDSVYDEESGKYIGKITNVKKTDAIALGLKDDGTLIETTQPNRYDVIVSIETNGTINDTGYFAEGVKNITPHSSIAIGNNKFKTSGNIQAVSEKK